jgi:hypothetical protein
MPEIHYRRLTRARARSTFSVVLHSRVSLWLGPNHLLSVDSSGFSETYKRFYFRDIQAFTIRQTQRRAIWNVILLVPIIGCLTGCLSEISFKPVNNSVVFIWLFFLTVFLVPFLFNNIFGTACVCHLRTAVQIEELPSLCRVRKTRRILAQIRPLILAAQGGELTAAAVSSRMRDWAMSSAGETPAGSVADPPGGASGGEA